MTSAEIGSASKIKHALRLKIKAECSTSKARTCVMTLPHAVVETPVFMPVGTQGTLKGLLPEQLEQLGCRLMLGNTYHLGNRPVSAIFGYYYSHLLLFILDMHEARVAEGSAT